MKRSDVRKLVAKALRDVAENLGGEKIWPDSTDEDRAAAVAVNAALDRVERALTKVADNLLTNKRKR